MRKILLTIALFLPCTPALAAIYFVSVGGTVNEYSPQFLTIAVGDTVQWTNIGGKHNVEADDDSFICSQGCKGDPQGDTGNPSMGSWIASHTFNTPGTFGYFCVLHGMPGGGMWGAITVGTTPVKLISFEVD